MIQLDLFSLLAFVTVVSAIFSYINIRFLRLPNTIGLMALALALALHFSAPLAVVACGLFIGNTGPNNAMSDQTLLFTLINFGSLSMNL